MKSYRFDIVRRKSDRFEWRVVAFDECGEQVIARSERSWRKRKKVWRAIAAIQEADVFDMSRPRGGNGFHLPATRFGIVQGIVPLVVPDRPHEFLTRERRDEARAEVLEEVVDEVLEEEAEEEAAQAEGRARLSRRTKKSE